MPTPFDGGPTSAVAFSVSTIVNALLPDSEMARRKWAGDLGTGAIISYSFASANSIWSINPETGYGPRSSVSEPWASEVGSATAEQANFFRAALTQWSNVANINFVEVEDTPNSVGDIRLGYSSLVGDYGAAAWAYYPFASGAAAPGDIWIDPEPDYNANVTAGGYGYLAMIHEIGHALGLAHPFQNGKVDKTFLTDLFATRMYSVMGYEPHPAGMGEPITPMLYDILAIQYIYGANQAYHAGDDVYQFIGDGVPIQAIWDAGGHDIIDLSSQSHRQVVDINAGHYSSVGTGVNNVVIAFGATIEGVNGGAGDDSISGNAADNTLSGGAGSDMLAGNGGDDILDGGTGNDALIGGDGNDNYAIDSLGDKITEKARAGTGDSVVTTLSKFTLGANVEFLVFDSIVDGATGTGNGLNNDILGTAGNDTLNGMAGNDALKGGAGNDSLTGSTGADQLNGGGGEDRLVGGWGNDIYTVDTPMDTIVELAGQGTDTVFATVSFDLSIQGANVENLQLIAGSGDLDGTGNDLNNILSGNDGANQLKGGKGKDQLDGGSGVDTLEGGLGNDIYVIDNFSDVVIEASGEGLDSVKSTLALTVLATNVENLILLGSDNLNGTGNELKNVLTGNAGANQLSGDDGNDRLNGGTGDDTLDGGAGNDYLIGAAGNDTYFVDSIGDKIIELSSGGGIDTVICSLSKFTLGSGMENLQFDSAVSRATGIGNALNNDILGTEGNDILNGGAGNDALTGGLGADTLTGGAGNDVFLYCLADTADLVDLGDDTILGFAIHKDKIDIHDLLADFQVASNDLFGDGFIALEVNGHDTLIKFDSTGGGNSFVTLATVSNVLVSAADLVV